MQAFNLKQQLNKEAERASSAQEQIKVVEQTVCHQLRTAASLLMHYCVTLQS